MFMGLSSEVRQVGDREGYPVAMITGLDIKSLRLLGDAPLVGRTKHGGS